MPDLPLDEKALKAAEAELYNADTTFDEEGVNRLLISTYLTAAGFEVEIEDRRIEFGPDAHKQRFVGPWLPVNKQEEE